MDNLTKYINKYGKISRCGPFEYYRIEKGTDNIPSYLALGWDDNGEGDWKEWHLEIPRLISKEYGFIKWLVENDKIDKKKIDKTERRPMYVTDDMFSLYDLDECVIMLLSISSSPIDFLISILK